MFLRGQGLLEGLSGGLDDLLDTVKRKTPQSFLIAECFVKVVKAGEFLSLEGEELKGAIVDRGFVLLEYFLEVTVHDVKRYGENAEADWFEIIEHSPSSFLAMYAQVKAHLWIECMGYIEDMLNERMDEVLKTNGRLTNWDRTCKEKNWEDDEEMMETREFIVKDIKAAWYESVLLEKYFTNKSGKQSLETFVGHIEMESSFFVGLKTTRVHSLQNTCTTLFERLELFQLLQRHTAFGYRSYWGEETLEVIEVRAMYDSINVMEYGDPKDVFEYLELMRKYIHLEMEDEENRMIDVLLICYGPFFLGDDGILMIRMMEELPEEIVRGEAYELLKAMSLLMTEHRAAQHPNFYSKYDIPFTLHEVRVREKMITDGELGNVKDTKKAMKHLIRHEKFFRYQFNVSALELGKRWEKLLDDFDKGKDVNSHIIKIDRITHERQSNIVHQYPPKEKTHYLELVAGIIDRHNDFLGELGIGYKLVGGKNKRSAKTVGRNDPCPCNSGKKYKKCCERNGV